MSVYVNTQTCTTNINYDGLRSVSACVHALVCVSLDLNPSHIPAFSLMGQQVSRSLTTLPVLFWPSWLRQRGCQSPQPFLFSYKKHTVLESLWHKLQSFFFIIIPMIWTNTAWGLFLYTGCSFHIIVPWNFTHLLCVFLGFWTSPPVDQPRK